MTAKARGMVVVEKPWYHGIAPTIKRESDNAVLV
jgi:hypothetical protein